MQSAKRQISHFENIVLELDGVGGYAFYNYLNFKLIVMGTFFGL